MKLNDRYGFTLAELLIVVAIIGVLSGVSIPIFSKQLEKSREATDLANVRSAYAEVVAAEITGDGSVKRESAGAYYIDVPLRQKLSDWQMTLPLTLGGVSSTDSEHWRGTPRAGGCCKIKAVDGEVFLYWNGNALANVAGDNGYQTEYFWYQKTYNNEVYLSRERPPSSQPYKNSVVPVALNKGDSFSVSSVCAIGNTQQGSKVGIFAFYLTEKDPQNVGSYNSVYKAVVDSGWLNYKDFDDGFTPVKNYVNNPEQYYTVEKQGDRLVFTVTRAEGLSLVVNNNADQNSAKMLNDVIIDRAN